MSVDYSLDGNGQQNRKARHPDHEDVKLVEPAPVQDIAHGQHQRESEEVEWRKIGEQGVRFHPMRSELATGI